MVGLEQPTLPVDRLGGPRTDSVDLPQPFQAIGLSPRLLEKFQQAKSHFHPQSTQGPLSVALYYSLDKLDPESQKADMQGRELDYVSALNKAQKFATLEDGLKEKHVSLSTHYTAPTSSAGAMREQFAKHLDAKGIVPGQLPLLQQMHGKDPLGQENLNLLDGSIDRLSDQFFGDVAQDKSAMKFFLRGLTQQIAQNAAEHPEQALTVSDTHRLLSEVTAAVYHQELAANRISIGDHGIDHLIKHNANGVQTSFDQLQSLGVPVTAKERILGSLVMIYHDLGYTAPTVTDSVSEVGIKGQDKGHGAVAARFVRESSDLSDHPLQKLLTPQDWNLFHRGVLYHDRTQENLPIEKFIVSPDLTPEERVHNFESVIRLADNSHAFSSKVSKPLTRNPEAFRYIRMMQVSDQLQKEGLSVGEFGPDFFKSGLNNSWERLDDSVPLRLREAGKALSQTMTPAEGAFLSKRLADADPVTSIEPDGRIQAFFPQGDNPIDQFGMATESKQIQGMLRDLDPGGQSGAQPTLVEMSSFELNPEAHSEFMKGLGAVFQKDPLFAAFNGKENSLKALHSYTSEVLTGSEDRPSAGEWMRSLAGDPAVLSAPELRALHTRLEQQPGDAEAKLRVFDKALQESRGQNFAAYCASASW